MIIGSVFTFAIILGLLGAIAEIIRQQMLPPEQKYNGPRPPKINVDDTVVDAKTLGATPIEVERILRKRFPYYNSLNTFQQVRFVARTVRFIQHKLFIIKSSEGFREMPVLASAAAIQLTFGLDDYLLPWFRYIQIYPQEFVSHHSLRIIVGNVSNHTITIAWNHLLKGYEDGDDGSNVALHEMSHALYFQKLEVEKLDALTFCNLYHELIAHCKLPYQFEMSGKTGLYTDYGCSNMQEFWAESIELFFEKSIELRRAYPKLYAALVALLNQDPTTKEKVMSESLVVLWHQFLGMIWRWQRKLRGYEVTPDVGW
jgi:Mlc titration factor MtfA (ptsG expression regulator)